MTVSCEDCVYKDFNCAISAAAFRGIELALTSMREERDDMRRAMKKIAMSVGCDTPLQLTAIATNDEDTTADLLVKFIAMKLDSARAEAVREAFEWLECEMLDIRGDHDPRFRYRLPDGRISTGGGKHVFARYLAHLAEKEASK